MLTTNNNNQSSEQSNASLPFVHSSRNTSLPVYVTDNQGNVIEPKQIVKKKLKPSECYVDKQGNFIEEVDDYSGGYSDNIEMRFNTSDKNAVEQFFNVPELVDEDDKQIQTSSKVLSRQMAITLSQLHGKMKLSDSTCDYQLASFVECENTVDKDYGTKVKGFKLLFKPSDAFFFFF